jgi:hypothetical protein
MMVPVMRAPVSVTTFGLLTECQTKIKQEAQKETKSSEKETPEKQVKSVEKEATSQETKVLAEDVCRRQEAPTGVKAQEKKGKKPQEKAKEKVLPEPVCRHQEAPTGLQEFETQPNNQETPIPVLAELRTEVPVKKPRGRKRKTDTTTGSNVDKTSAKKPKAVILTSEWESESTCNPNNPKTKEQKPPKETKKPKEKLKKEPKEKKQKPEKPKKNPLPCRIQFDAGDSDTEEGATLLELPLSQRSQEKTKEIQSPRSPEYHPRSPESKSTGVAQNPTGVMTNDALTFAISDDEEESSPDLQQESLQDQEIEEGEVDEDK